MVRKQQDIESLVYGNPIKHKKYRIYFLIIVLLVIVGGFFGWREFSFSYGADRKDFDTSFDTLKYSEDVQSFTEVLGNSITYNERLVSINQKLSALNARNPIIFMAAFLQRKVDMVQTDDMEMREKIDQSIIIGDSLVDSYAVTVRMEYSGNQNISEYSSWTKKAMHFIDSQVQIMEMFIDSPIKITNASLLTDAKNTLVRIGTELQEVDSQITILSDFHTKHAIYDSEMEQLVSTANLENAFSLYRKYIDEYSSYQALVKYISGSSRTMYHDHMMQLFEGQYDTFENIKQGFNDTGMTFINIINEAIPNEQSQDSFQLMQANSLTGMRSASQSRTQYYSSLREAMQGKASAVSSPVLLGFIDRQLLVFSRVIAFIDRMEHQISQLNDLKRSTEGAIEEILREINRVETPDRAFIASRLTSLDTTLARLPTKNAIEAMVRNDLSSDIPAEVAEKLHMMAEVQFSPYYAFYTTSVAQRDAIEQRLSSMGIMDDIIANTKVLSNKAGEVFGSLVDQAEATISDFLGF